MCACVCSHIPRPSQKWKEGVVNGWHGIVHCKMLGLLNLLSLVEPSAEPKAMQKLPCSQLEKREVTCEDSSRVVSISNQYTSEC